MQWWKNREIPNPTELAFWSTNEAGVQWHGSHRVPQLPRGSHCTLQHLKGSKKSYEEKKQKNAFNLINFLNLFTCSISPGVLPPLPLTF